MGETTVTDLDIRIGIEELLFAYCDFVDRARFDELTALFVDEAVIDYGLGRLIEGPTAARAFFEDRMGAYVATSHHSSNIRMRSVDADTANVESSVYAWHERPDGSQAEIWGRYSDVVVRDDHGWRFRSRRIRSAGSLGFPTPAGQQSPFEMIDREVTQ